MKIKSNSKCKFNSFSAVNSPSCDSAVQRSYSRRSCREYVGRVCVCVCVFSGWWDESVRTGGARGASSCQRADLDLELQRTHTHSHTHSHTLDTTASEARHTDPADLPRPEADHDGVEARVRRDRPALDGTCVSSSSTFAVRPSELLLSGRASDAVRNRHHCVLRACTIHQEEKQTRRRVSISGD